MIGVVTKELISEELIILAIRYSLMEFLKILGYRYLKPDCNETQVLLLQHSLPMQSRKLSSLVGNRKNVYPVLLNMSLDNLLSKRRCPIAINKELKQNSSLPRFEVAVMLLQNSLATSADRENDRMPLPSDEQLQHKALDQSLSPAQDKPHY